MSKANVELTAEVIGKAIEDGRFSSMTQLAHHLGYKGSVSSTLTRKFKLLVPAIASLMERNKPAKHDVKASPAVAKPTATETKSSAPKGKSDKTIKTDKTVPKPSGAKGGKFARDPRNPFRPGSTYGKVFDILASYPDGLEKEMLVRLVSAETKKGIKLASFDTQVVLSARGSEAPGLSRNNGPRNRSARNGYWVQRTNGHVKLVVDKE